MNHSNNLNLNNDELPAIMNQRLNNPRSGIIYHLQGVSTSINRQFYPQNAAVVVQRNVPLSSINNNYSIGNNNSFSLGSEFLTQRSFDLVQDNNIHNNITYSITRHTTMNFPPLRELLVLNGAQRINAGVRRFQPPIAAVAIPAIPVIPAIPASTTYVDIVKDSPEKNEFRMSSKDFPELPQSSTNSVAAIDTQWTKVSYRKKTKPPIVEENDDKPDVTIIRRPNITDRESVAQSLCDIFSRATNISQTPQPSDSVIDSNNQNENPKIGVQIFPDGKITNVPDGVIRDQYGLLGLLSTVKSAETDPDLSYLNFGEDLTTLGLDLNSSEDILPKFAGAFGNNQLQPHDVDPNPDFTPIPEYKLKGREGFKLAPFNVSLYKEDLLFYLFYTHTGSKIQLKAAQELRARGWRYHMEHHVWLTCLCKSDIEEKTDSFERGTYYVFDVESWRKVAMDMVIEYSKMERIPEEYISIDLPEEPPLNREWIQNTGFHNK